MNSRSCRPIYRRWNNLRREIQCWKSLCRQIRRNKIKIEVNKEKSSKDQSITHSFPIRSPAPPPPLEDKRQSRRKGMEGKGNAERPNSSRGYHGCYLTRRNRTDAKRVYGFCGCRKRATALLRDSTALQIRKSQDGSAGVSAFCPGFFVHFYAFRTPFLRVQVKSYYPLCEQHPEALKAGRWIGPKCVGWWADLRLSVGILN